MYNLFEKLNKNIGFATCCTEPDALANFLRLLAKYLDENDRVIGMNIHMSMDFYRNSLNSQITELGSNTTIPLVAILGIILKNSTKTEIFKNLSVNSVQAAKRLAEKIKYEETIDNTKKGIYIKAILQTKNGHQIEGVLKDTHSNIISIFLDGNNIFQGEEINKKTDDYTIEDIWDLLKTDDFSDDFSKDLYRKVIETNLKFAYKTLEQSNNRFFTSSNAEHESIENQIATITAMCVESRMRGKDETVATNSGSGNQGLVATIPVIEYALLSGIKTDEEQLIKAVAFSSYMAMYLRRHSGTLSNLCGIVTATAGALAGILYLENASKEKIESKLNTFMATNIGILCDGAKPSCAFKAFQNVLFGLNILKLEDTEQGIGIIGTNLKETTENISLIEKASKEEILNQMVKILKTNKNK